MNGGDFGEHTDDTFDTQMAADSDIGPFPDTSSSEDRRKI